MISLHRTVTEMERLKELQASTSEAYKFAMRSVAQYAVEVDRQDAAAFRKQLTALERRHEDVKTSDEVRSIQASFRGELRDYHERAKAQLDRLHAELEAGAAAVASLASSVTSNGTDHEVRVKTEMASLHAICGWSDLNEIRQGIHRVIHGLTDAVENMQRSNRVVILQMQDEIRMLHQDIDAKRRALTIDPATGAWNSEKSESRLVELLQVNEPFTILLVTIKNFDRIRGRFSERVVNGALKALVARLHAIKPKDAGIGRRTDGEFIVVLDADPTGAISLSKEALSRLSTVYAIQDAGSSTNVPLEVATGIVERPPGLDQAAFLKKLNQLSSALART